MSLNLFTQYNYLPLLNLNYSRFHLGNIQFQFLGVKNTISSKYNIVLAGPKQQIAVFI